MKQDETIEVRLFATLRDNRGNIVESQWCDGMDGYALLESLDLAPEDVAIFLINGKHSPFDSMINVSDIIALFPPLGGG